jgi:DNA polymerase
MTLTKNSPILWLDFETRGTVDLTKTSAHHYTEECQEILLGYAFNDEPAQVVDFLAGEELPKRVREALAGTEYWLAAFNIGFERNVFAHSPRFSFANNSPERWFDVQTMAYEAGISPVKPLEALSLAALSEALDIDHVKTDPGGKLKKLFCKPMNQENEFHQPHHAKSEWIQFKDYCANDVEAMREVFKHPLVQNNEYPFNPREKAVADVDQVINDRGIPINGEFCLKAAIAAQAAGLKQDDIVAMITLGEVTKITQKVRIRKWINEHFDMSLQSVGAETIGLVRSTTDNPVLQTLCDLILDSGTAGSKYSAALYASSSDSRVHGALFMCGASRTRRWGGRLIQPQNMRRPKGTDDEIARTREAILCDNAPGLLPPILDCVRSIIEAPSGTRLLSADYAAIENRALMWLANCRPMLKFFGEVDAGTASADPYEFTYGSAFGVDPTKINKKQRFIGKMMMLMFQYLGGVGGLISGLQKNQIDIFSFCSDLVELLPSQEIARGCKEYHFVQSRGGNSFDLTPEQYGACAALKNRWREAHPEVVNLGNELQDGFVTLADSKVGTTLDLAGGKIKLARDTHHIRLSLYGGQLSYPLPEVKGRGVEVMGITKVKGPKHVLCPIPYYSGKFLENVASALSRNIMALALVRLESHGFKPIFHVHDEIVLEIPDDGKDYEAEVIDIMTEKPADLLGFPLAASAWTGPYYKKD